MYRWVFFEKHKAVSADSETAIADGLNLGWGKSVFAREIINHHEIIAGGLVFKEMNFQSFVCTRANRGINYLTSS